MELRVIVCIVCMFAMVLSFPERPFFIDCLDSAECDKSACCVIGLGRFSIPTCRQKPDLGETCRPVSDPANLNVSYPDGSVVSLTQVYYTICPCGYGLTCGQKGICEDPSITESFNDLTYF